MVEELLLELKTSRITDKKMHKRDKNKSISFFA